MRFLMLYRPDPESPEGARPAPEHMAAMGKLVEDMTRSGALLSTEGLLPRSACACVERSGGKVTVREANERIAGFALVQATSKEEAIQMASEFLAVAGDGVSEIRQVMEFAPQPG